MKKIINKEILPNGVVVLTMNNPEVNNNITWKAAEDLFLEIKSSRESGSNIFILASALSDHWFEHAWLEDILAIYEGRETTAPGVSWFYLMRELTHPDIITIASINGRASGGGAEIGWACDLRIAEEGVKFCQPEVDLNLTTGLGGTSRVARLIGPTKAAELVFLGNEFSAEEMLDLKAINRLVKKGDSLKSSKDLADELSKKPKDALVLLKKILNDSLELPLSEALRSEQDLFQSIVNSDGATKKMRDVQDMYFKGIKPKDIIY